MFEGIRGVSFEGDIAIDDYLISEGTCGYVDVISKPNHTKGSQ